MPYHRTAVFKAHDPSGRKLRRVKKMQRRYSSVYSPVEPRRPDEFERSRIRTKANDR